MYENITFNNILQRMLDRVPNNVDKREGSIIYDALAPAAVELQMAYIELDNILNQTFADTASREYLIKRCNERGISVQPATYAIRQGEFNINVPIGSRFSLNLLDYIVIEQINEGVFKLQCETLGSVGNTESGSLMPIDYIDGLTKATLTDVLIPGEDEEDTEHLRERYYSSLNAQAFGGNVTDYKEKTNSINGVGGVKVHPVWNGGGTVKLVIINSEYEKPSDLLVNEVQTVIDPIQNQGAGAGIAPIGHVVTVIGCATHAVDITTTITYQEGWNWNSVKPYVEQSIDKYFKELAAEWDSNDNLIVRISQIETRLLDVAGILDVFNTKLNGLAENLIIEGDYIPIRGEINV